ncbi:amidohydrolase family protein [candidate division KSB1 bacterium]
MHEFKNKLIFRLIMVCMIIIVFSLPVLGQDILIRNATVITGTGETIENGSVLVQNGKITRIGANISAPSGVKVVDGSGKFVMSGIIDAHSHLSINGINEGTTQNSAMADVSDALRIDDYGTWRALAGGVTAIHTLHGSANHFGAKDEVLKLKWGRSIEEMKIEDNPEGLKMALGENPLRRETRYPNTRMGQEFQIRSYFIQAQEYKKAWDDYEAKVAGKMSLTEAEKEFGPIPPRKDLRLETLKDVLEGTIRVHVHGYVNSEMAMMLEMAKDFGFHITSFEHVLEGFMIADEFAEQGTVASAFVDSWNYKVEASQATPFMTALMTERGAVVNLHSDSGERIRRLNLDAAKTLRYGDTMTETDALKTVTLNAAIGIDLEHRMGTLEVGKDGDISIWDAHPLSVYSKCVMTIIEGEVFFDRNEALTTEKWLQGVKPIF